MDEPLSVKKLQRSRRIRQDRNSQLPTNLASCGDGYKQKGTKDFHNTNGSFNLGHGKRGHISCVLHIKLALELINVLSLTCRYWKSKPDAFLRKTHVISIIRGPSPGFPCKCFCFEKKCIYQLIPYLLTAHFRQRTTPTLSNPSNF